MAVVTLSYRIGVGLQSAAALAARVGAIVLNTGELALLGMSIMSDVTVVDGCDLVRTVVLETNAQGNELFPTPTSLRDATRQLWRSRLNLLVPGVVTVDEPVVS
jgi:hypothetical protein